MKKATVQLVFDFGTILKLMAGFAVIMLIFGVVICSISKDFLFLLFWVLFLSPWISCFFIKKLIIIDSENNTIYTFFSLHKLQYKNKAFPINSESKFKLDYVYVDSAEGTGWSIVYFFVTETNNNYFKIKLHAPIDEILLDLKPIWKAGLNFKIDDEILISYKNKEALFSMPKIKTINDVNWY